MVNWSSIDKLVQAERCQAVVNEEILLRDLRIWWCSKYTRPFKDPLLAQYTLNELIYEYLTYHYLSPDNDPLVKKQVENQKQNDDEWIKQQMQQIKPSQPPNQPGQPEDKQIPLPPEISTRFD